MKLNLGCGDRYAAGWVNVDLPSTPHRKDQAVDLTQPLPWPEESIELAYLGHLLEHLTLEQCHNLLTDLYTRMKPYGVITVVGPDVELAAELEAGGYVLEVPLEQLKHGAGRWSGDVHRWECTRAKLGELLVGAGWQNVRTYGVEEVADIWPVAVRGPRWQVAASGEAL